MRKLFSLLSIGISAFAFATFALADATQPSTESLQRQVIHAPTTSESEVNPVAQDQMQKIYDEVKTPFKYGIVIRPDEGTRVDCPSIFRMNNSFWMLYVCFNKVGYETHLAQSDDLLHWKPLGTILPFDDKGGWDQWQCDGGMSLIDTAWGGSAAPEQYDGKYWLSYIGGALKGYETDPLSTGLAYTSDPTKPQTWTRLPENPVLSTTQPDVREYEKRTLYKSTIIHDPDKTVGYPFLMYYNGKLHNGYERIGMAVSNDMVHWMRYGNEPIVANATKKKNRMSGMSGDPQIVKIGNVWVMFYFGSGWKSNPSITGAPAFDTFACSNDLVHWTKWTGPNLIQPSEGYDHTYAHKPWVLKWNGVVYHYYCAVGKDPEGKVTDHEFRSIALATSKDLSTPSSTKP